MAEYKISSQKHLEGDKSFLEVVFEGQLNLHNALTIKKEMEELKFDNEKNVVLKTKNVDSLDVSFLQLVEALKKQLTESNKKVYIVMDLPYDLKTLLANSGISYPHKHTV